jgi:hypothetical protein
VIRRLAWGPALPHGAGEGKPVGVNKKFTLHCLARPPWVRRSSYFRGSDASTYTRAVRQTQFVEDQSLRQMRLVALPYWHELWT